eukprot:GHVR01073360.1.p1 GENE.GHVR01073360.1~~GHVR01073360.1.p1  ORF type:complete len:244 (+),score=45.23 GHVR01073360.1:46-777(+)
MTDRAYHLSEMDIPLDMQNDLIKCSGTDIVVIADDSGSMKLSAGNKKSRWEELQQTLESLLHVLLAVDHKNGFHLCLLNKPKFVNFMNIDQVNNLFDTTKPHNGTPLMAALESVFRGDWNPGTPYDDVIVIVMTDGVPSDCTMSDLEKVIRKRPSNYYMSFLMCTNEDAIVDMYNKLIDPIPGCDITDDFHSEAKQCENKRGKKLSYNEWIVKCVLGGKFSKYDKKDEKKKDDKANTPCCTIQ